jgi:hypothetical protein
MSAHYVYVLKYQAVLHKYVQLLDVNKSKMEQKDY